MSLRAALLDMDDFLDVLPAAKWTNEKVAAEARHVVESFANTWCREQRWREVSPEQLDVIAANADAGARHGQRNERSYSEVAQHARHLAEMKRTGTSMDMPCNGRDFLAEGRRRGLSLEETVQLHAKRFPAGMVYPALPPWVMEEWFHSWSLEEWKLHSGK